MDITPIEELLRRCADAHCGAFLEAGHASSGCNGPYGCPDTPVRNSGHWLVILCYLWQTAGQELYKTTALRLARYLLDEQGKSASGAIACVGEGWGDRINGVIGQAWTIEALVCAYEAFGDAAYLDCAVRIFRSQDFDERTGFWKRVDPDGTARGFDLTFNHQLWFCIGGLLILQHREDETIRRCTEQHLALAQTEYFGIHPSGLIRHFGAMKRPRAAFNSLYLKQYTKYAGLALGLLRDDRTDILVQEEGYHVFELFGWAQIRRLRDLPLFGTPAFRKALAYDADIAAMDARLGADCPESMNKYAYGYNSPAMEIPFVDLMFTGQADEEKVLGLLARQKELCFDPETGRMARCTADPETLTARLYEYVRFCACCRERGLTA